MSIRMRSTPAIRLMTVLGFVVAGIIIALYLLSGSHLRIPLLNEPHVYEVSAQLEDADNLVRGGQVRIAGVQVGDVQAIEQHHDHVEAVMSLYSEHVPLHEGATVRVGARSLVEESYLEVRDGDGEPIESGTTLPREATQHSTQLRDVLDSLDPETRDAMSSLMQSAGEGTEGTSEDFADTLAGLGDLGRDGHTALDAIAAQSEDLTALAGHTETLLSALDTSEGAIARMVENTDRLTAATSAQSEAISGTMRKLPGVLASADSAGDSLTELSGSLAPVAANLSEAAPHLSDALAELPATSADLRGLLPSLSGTLDKAPPTLERLPRFSGDMAELIPESIAMLRDVNPMLAYLEPYGPEIAAWFANFNAISRYTDEAGVHYFRLMPILNDMSVVSPLETGEVLSYKNPIPEPGAGADPGSFDREYPKVERDPDPREEPDSE
ncbi:phospholipid/cholesterol/gamma-HCH transport system substrate-binding protein [Haloechinothrix alba]|uniref:Phospholipid/cholesterol/gamma-HCH transport system substrate-binding protein n=1 Tax=Haloechinothrix alba TaxID=664784 RepID=A0A238Y6Q7_9PSEU|nr:MlaD family protein [Haloechinothrix alba]SNR66019.1 phospholipid/cholesterol/gamma-HCH transport system substrate-binding protein [Haloechinothrix alba]